MFAKAFPWDKGRICCENCPDRTPHVEGWEWSEEWNIEQHAKHQELRKAKKIEEEDLPD
jgi:hypothetical protein